MKMKKGNDVIECIPLVKNVWERAGYEEYHEPTKEELQAELESKGVEFDKRWGVDKLKELL